MTTQTTMATPYGAADLIAVERRLSGDTGVRLTDADQYAGVLLGTQRELAAGALALLLGMHVNRVRGYRQEVRHAA